MQSKDLITSKMSNETIKKHLAIIKKEKEKIKELLKNE